MSKNVIVTNSEAEWNAPIKYCGAQHIGAEQAEISLNSLQQQLFLAFTVEIPFSEPLQWIFSTSARRYEVNESTLEWETSRSSFS